MRRAALRTDARLQVPWLGGKCMTHASQAHANASFGGRNAKGHWIFRGSEVVSSRPLPVPCSLVHPAPPQFKSGDVSHQNITRPVVSLLRAIQYFDFLGLVGLIRDQTLLCCVANLLCNSWIPKPEKRMSPNAMLYFLNQPQVKRHAKKEYSDRSVAVPMSTCPETLCPISTRKADRRDIAARTNKISIPPCITS